MKNILNELREDKTALIGIILLVMSLLTFLITSYEYDIDNEIFTGVFFWCFCLTGFYWLVVAQNNREVTGRFFKFSNFRHNVLLLQLFNVSAYSLNRTIPVFDISANWVVVFLVISNACLILHVLRKDYQSDFLNHLIIAISTMAFIFHLYESIYIGPIYPIVLVGFWLFGIPIHAFVPIFYVITFGMVLYHFIKKTRTAQLIITLSATFTIALITVISVRFYNINTAIIENFHTENEPYQDSDLPSWVELSQTLKKDWITERVLKSGIVYANSSQIFGRGFGLDALNMDERIKHDPLIMIASFFSQELKINDEDRLNIFRSMYDERHKTERKLWSGESLSTSDIVTNTQLFPDYRMAYTEKTFKIHNSQINTWRTREEAFYTFYLPEGSVVTSAALWVEGMERPAYLTTKSKADSAYKRIVGVERRDPLLLHWQEGNRVTVRVFPCTPSEDRQFKIGITSPLKKEGEQLVYQNIDFEGPYWKDAHETINIVTEGALQDFDASLSFKRDGMIYRYSGDYKSDWSLRFDANRLSQKAFAFNGRAFQLTPNAKEMDLFDPAFVYLDINAAWTRAEFDEVWKALEGKEMIVHSNHKMEELTEANRVSLFKSLQAKNFTLFPFYKIEPSDRVLVISKYSQLTPTLKDLEKTPFMEKTTAFFQKKEFPLRVFNLNENISPYLRTLRELRSIQLETGSDAQLIDYFKKNEFPRNQEGQRTIVNHYADFQIKELELDSIEASDAPDHLMRLFTYNDVLKRVGKHYFNKKALERELVELAEEAHVVTPISSLVVLETQADYDRFDIKKNKNGLGNASIGNSGAVPEPHEWLLILLVAGLTMYFYFRKN
ncbi:MAG: XrtN system VIT domain-containing protein [Saprospiraceae bacterium]